MFKGLGRLQGKYCDLKCWPVQMALERSDKLSQMGKLSQRFKIGWFRRSKYVAKVRYKPKKPEKPDKHEELKFPRTNNKKYRERSIYFDMYYLLSI